MIDTQSPIANGARGEVTLELGGEAYLLKPEFGVIARIEQGLETSLFKLAMKAELFDLRAEELVRTLQVVLAANGYERAERDLAEAIARSGVGPVLVPLLVFLRGYVWGGGHEKKAPEPDAPEEAPEDTPDTAAANGASPTPTPTKAKRASRASS